MLSTGPSASCLAVIALTLTLVACDDDGSTQPPAPLTIASITPAANATSVSIDQPIQISFSSAVDPSSVTSTSVVVSRNATPVAGSLAVQGSTVTFTPAASYTEFRSQYAVSVTTAVRSTAGGALNTAFNSTFTTVMFDSLYYYQVINAGMGPGKALGTFAGGLQCFFADVGTGTGQQWYVTEIPASTFLLFRNRFQGAGHGLEGGTVGQPCLLTTLATGGTNFTGQAWNVTAEGTGYRMTNQNLGAGSSLGIVLVNNEQRPGMTATSAIASQSWSFARLIRR